MTLGTINPTLSIYVFVLQRQLALSRDIGIIRIDLNDSEDSMPNILIRGLPDEVHQALKRRALLNGRSLQKEVQSILAETVGDASDRHNAMPALHISAASLTGKIGREQIYGDDR